MTNRFASACGALVFGLLAAAQGSAQDGLAIRVVTSKEGLHRIPGAALKPLANLDAIAPDRLTVTHEGQPVPIEVFGASDGRFDPSDEILFFAARPSGRYSKTESYVLSDRGRPMRMRPQEAARGVSDALSEVRVVGHVAQSSVFSEIPTVRQDVIRGPARSPWFTASLAPQGARARRGDQRSAEGDPSTAAIPAILDPRPITALPARLRVDVFGATVSGILHTLQVNVNGVDLKPESWETPLQTTLLITIPKDVLRRENLVRFRNVSEVAAYSEPGNELMARRRNDILIERFAIIYDAQIVGPSVSGQQTVVHVAPGEGSKPRQIRIEQRQREGYLVVEPKSGRLWRGSIVEIPSDREVTLAICSLGGAYTPDAIERLRPTREHLDRSEGDYVIVTTTDLKPAVAMLADHRRTEGFTPVVVEARELYDAFTNGAFHPAAIQRFLVAAMQNWEKKPRYLLLVGDADADGEFLNQREPLPAWLVMTDYNGHTATDGPHGDIDADGLPDIPVGRIPTRTREDFLNFARRVIALETNPPPGAWRRTVTFFAGEGRFGPVIDDLLEKQAKAVISQIPPEYDVRMTYGNPTSAWYWPAEDFNAHLIRSFNEGALVFTYIGHGSPDAFDYVTSGTANYRILGESDIEQLSSEGRSPVMAIIACSTGRYADWERDCLAEKMLLKEGGPIAVIAASRISHPYPNALLGKGIAQPFFDGRNRVGDAFRAGTQSMLQGAKNLLNRGLAAAFLSKAVNDQSLVRDHAVIYNLLGDPAQKVPFPAAIDTIEAPEKAAPGATIEIRATIPGATLADAVVSLEAGRGARMRPAADSGPTNAGDGDPATRAAAIRARHAAANDHALVRERARVDQGVLSASLAIPADTPPGVYAIVVVVEGGSGSTDAAGARKIRVE